MSPHEAIPSGDGQGGSVAPMPIERFTKEVESAIIVAGASAHGWVQYGKAADMNWETEALASIQASTVKLLEGLKRYSFEHERSHKQIIEVMAIDQLIKDLSK